MKIAAIVLAAGRSSRMGSNKLLADMGGKPLIAWTIQNILDSQVREVFVVTGHEADETKAALGPYKVKILHNANFASGLASSVGVGVSAARDFDGALICLGDMPLVSPAIINALIEAFDPLNDGDIVVPLHQGMIGNPVLWGAKFFTELQQLQGDRGARGLIEKYTERVVRIDIDDEAVALDSDTPEGLAHIRSIAGF